MGTLVTEHLFLTLILAFALYSRGIEAQGDTFKHRRFYNPGGPGPWVIQTHGEVWPKPKVVKSCGQNFSVVQVADFVFKLEGEALKCETIREAAKRCYARTFPNIRSIKHFEPQHPWYNSITSSRGFRGVIREVEVVMNNARGCEKWPHMDMDEHYEIKIDAPDEPNRARIIAFSVWGILRGLESFSQLVYNDEDKGGLYIIKSQQLMDQPRFSWRGVMLDTSRHFLSKRAIMDNLDLMEMNKMNVFHWHVTDDPSFPYESLTFPELSLKGAYRAYTHVYSQEDVREIVEYARIRGIRVVAEFDTPGHTQSWGPGQPGVLTECYTGSSPNGEHGPMNPTNESLYGFLRKFFKEVTTVFPDKFLHLGGDEVQLDCWKSNPDIKDYVQSKLSGDFRKLESVFIERLLNIIRGLGKENDCIVWEEVFTNKDKVTNNTVIHVWKGGDEKWQETMNKVTYSGLRGILSSPWYLNYISYGSDWVKYYKVDPLSFTASEKQKRLVLGGEACMWGEFVNSLNLLPRLWPRASAVAERLWSDRSVNDPKEAAKRLQEHECRMLRRGYPVEPANGPGFCSILWDNEI